MLMNVFTRHDYISCLQTLRPEHYELEPSDQINQEKTISTQKYEGFRIFPPMVGSIDQRTYLEKRCRILSSASTSSLGVWGYQPFMRKACTSKIYMCVKCVCV